MSQHADLTIGTLIILLLQKAPFTTAEIRSNPSLISVTLTHCFTFFSWIHLSMTFYKQHGDPSLVHYIYEQAVVSYSSFGEHARVLGTPELSTFKKTLFCDLPQPLVCIHSLTPHKTAAVLSFQPPQPLQRLSSNTPQSRAPAPSQGRMQPL